MGNFLGLVESSQNRLLSTAYQKKDFEKKNDPNHPEGTEKGRKKSEVRNVLHLFSSI